MKDKIFSKPEPQDWIVDMKNSYWGKPYLNEKGNKMVPYYFYARKEKRYHCPELGYATACRQHVGVKR